MNFVAHVKLYHQFCGLWVHAKLPMTFRVHSPAPHIPIAPPSTKCIVSHRRHCMKIKTDHRWEEDFLLPESSAVVI